MEHLVSEKNIVNTFKPAHFDFEWVAKSIVVIRKNHESAVSTEDEKASDADNIQPNGPIIRLIV